MPSSLHNLISLAVLLHTATPLPAFEKRANARRAGASQDAFDKGFEELREEELRANVVQSMTAHHRSLRGKSDTEAQPLTWWEIFLITVFSAAFCCCNSIRVIHDDRNPDDCEVQICSDDTACGVILRTCTALLCEECCHEEERAECSECVDALTDYCLDTLCCGQGCQLLLERCCQFAQFVMCFPFFCVHGIYAVTVDFWGCEKEANEFWKRLLGDGCKNCRCLNCRGCNCGGVGPYSGLVSVCFVAIGAAAAVVAAVGAFLVASGAVCVRGLQGCVGVRADVDVGIGYYRLTDAVEFLCFPVQLARWVVGTALIGSCRCCFCVLFCTSEPCERGESWPLPLMLPQVCGRLHRAFSRAVSSRFRMSRDDPNVELTTAVNPVHARQFAQDDQEVGQKEPYPSTRGAEQSVEKKVISLSFQKELDEWRRTNNLPEIVPQDTSKTVLNVDNTSTSEKEKKKPTSKWVELTEAQEAECLELNCCSTPSDNVQMHTSTRALRTPAMAADRWRGDPVGPPNLNSNVPHSHAVGAAAEAPGAQRMGRKLDEASDAISGAAAKPKTSDFESRKYRSTSYKQRQLEERVMAEHQERCKMFDALEARVDVGNRRAEGERSEGDMVVDVTEVEDGTDGAVAVLQATVDGAPSASPVSPSGRKRGAATRIKFIRKASSFLRAESAGEARTDRAIGEREAAACPAADTTSAAPDTGSSPDFARVRSPDGAHEADTSDGERTRPRRTPRHTADRGRGEGGPPELNAKQAERFTWLEGRCAELDAQIAALTGGSASRSAKAGRKKTTPREVQASKSPACREGEPSDATSRKLPKRATTGRFARAKEKLGVAKNSDDPAHPNAAVSSEIDKFEDIHTDIS